MKIIAPLLFSLTLSSAYAENAPEHVKAITVAREGNIPKALQMMQDVAAKQGWYDALIYDYIVILTWGKRDLEAYDLFHEKVDKKTAPTYVIEAIAAACRQLKLFAESKRYFTQIKEKEPHNANAYVGLANLEIDQGEPFEAILILAEAEKKIPHNSDIYLILGKAYYQGEKYADALRYYNKVLDINPKQPDALQGQAFCIKQLKGPFEALEDARKHPNLFTKDQIKDMEEARAATLVNWGKIDRDNLQSPTERYVYLDRAIADLKSQILDTDNQNRKYWLRLDLIVAYVYRNRHRDAINLYTKILSKGKKMEDIPVYVLEGIGDAFLDLHQPEKAKEVFKCILERDYKNPKGIDGYFNALLDCNEPETAMAFIQKHRTGAHLSISVIGSSYLNKDRVQVDETYNTAFLFEGLLSKADTLTKEGIQTMPLNTTMRNLRGNVLQARGLSRAAELEYQIGLTNDPKSNSLLLSMARTNLALNEPEKAEEIMHQVEKTHPESGDLTRFKKEWKSYNSREFVSDTTYETGGASNTGGQSFTSDNRLYSQPFANHYRAFASLFYQWGTFEEGILSEVLEGAGLEYRNRNVYLLGEVNSTQWGRTRAGLLVEGGYQPLDAIKFSAKSEINSRQTPGRGVINNITSNYYSLTAEYYKNESFEITVSGYLQSFSDDNTWVGGTGSIKQRAIEAPSYTLDLRFDIGARSSTTNNVPYYSPLKDGYVSLSPIFTQTLYQRYEQGFEHIITPEVGEYWEKGFGKRLTFGLSYEQRWKYQNWYEIGYGFSRRRQYYDGQKQYSTAFLLKLNIKF